IPLRITPAGITRRASFSIPTASPYFPGQRASMIPRMALRMAEFVIRSPWGVGIMGVDATNHLRCYSMFPYSSVLNDWYLQSGDVIAGPGNFRGGADRKELLIVKP